MKLSLEEARKRATPVALRVKEGTADIREVGGPRTIAFAYSTHEGEEQVYNAALLAHRWNTHDELVEALGELFEDWQTLVGQDLRENNADVAKIWKKSEAVLARAKTVEMP